MNPLFRRLRKGNRSITLNNLQIKMFHSVTNKIISGEYEFEKLHCTCGNENDILLSEIDRYGFEINTLMCKNCGLIRTDPYFTDTTLSKFYDNEYRPLYVGMDTYSYDFFLDQINLGRDIYRFVDEFMGKKIATVYEIGCGAGGILKYFQERKCEVYGSDLGNEYLKYGKKQGLKLVHGSAEELKKFGKADLVILNHVIEHFKNPVEYLKKIRALIKPGGMLYVGAPGIKIIPELYKYDLLFYLQNAHAYHYTLNTLSFVLGQAGYRLQKGNERIQSVFTLSEKPVIVEGTNHEYKRILRRLRAYELIYKIKKILPDKSKIAK